MDSLEIVKRLGDSGRLKSRPHISAKSWSEVADSHLQSVKAFMRNPPRDPTSMRGALEGLLEAALQLASRVYPAEPVSIPGPVPVEVVAEHEVIAPEVVATAVEAYTKKPTSEEVITAQSVIDGAASGALELTDEATRRLKAGDVVLVSDVRPAFPVAEPEDASAPADASDGQPEALPRSRRRRAATEGGGT